LSNPIPYPLDFYRAPGKNIGFVRNDKCASTFFSNIFAANGWRLQTTDQVNWEKDHVFSFTMDPYIRHIKGLVKDAVDMGLEKVMLANLGMKFWHNLSWIGTHSMPTSVRFGHSIHRINWIPIDIGLESTENIVDELLKSYDITINWGISVDRNESSDYEKELFHKFSQLSNSQEKQHLLRVICRDYEVYEKSVKQHSQ
jgi:hypothetical protein